MEPKLELLEILIMLAPILFMIPFIALFGFWIWMLIDCLTKESPQGNDKIVWTLVVIFGSIIGAFLYFFIRRPQRIKQASYCTPPLQVPMNKQAVTSIALGIAGPPLYSILIGFFLSIAAIILGHISLKQIRSGQTRGREIARAGLIMGYAPLVLFFAAIAIIAAVAIIFGEPIENVI
ncbi:MAG: DUF4190 domain-containing protein [Kiritimatiellae bacterium]|jgi:hypothetical protein|nr:DUF4190 domain-containing protein [Kiritimatiellia bacterium]